MKKVIVAGGAGFIGSHLVDRLLTRNDVEKIIIVDNLWTGEIGNLAHIEKYFALPTAVEIVQALEKDGDEWCQKTAAALRKRSPLMLEVVLEQIRRARDMTLAEDLRMERDMVRVCQVS